MRCTPRVGVAGCDYSTPTWRRHSTISITITSWPRWACSACAIPTAGRAGQGALADWLSSRGLAFNKAKTQITPRSGRGLPGVSIRRYPNGKLRTKPNAPSAASTPTRGDWLRPAYRTGSKPGGRPPAEPAPQPVGPLVGLLRDGVRDLASAQLTAGLGVAVRAAVTESGRVRGRLRRPARRRAVQGGSVREATSTSSLGFAACGAVTGLEMCVEAAGCWRSGGVGPAGTADPGQRGGSAGFRSEQFQPAWSRHVIRSLLCSTYPAGRDTPAVGHPGRGLLLTIQEPAA